MEFESSVHKRTETEIDERGRTERKRGAVHAARLRKPIMIIEWAHRHDAAKRLELEKKTRWKRDREREGADGPQESSVPRHDASEQGEKKIERREAK